MGGSVGTVLEDSQPFYVKCFSWSAIPTSGAFTLLRSIYSYILYRQELRDCRTAFTFFGLEVPKETKEGDELVNQTTSL